MFFDIGEFSYISSFFINEYDDRGSKTLFEFLPGANKVVKHTTDFEIYYGTTIL